MSAKRRALLVAIYFNLGFPGLGLYWLKYLRDGPSSQDRIA